MAGYQATDDPALRSGRRHDIHLARHCLNVISGQHARQIQEMNPRFE
jgi:hypothetical protein